MKYQMILKVNVNCFVLAHLCFLQFMTMMSFMISNNLRNRLEKKYFNNTPVNSTATHKHLGVILDSKLSCENHLQSVFSSVKKTIYFLRKLESTLPRKPRNNL